MMDHRSASTKIFATGIALLAFTMTALPAVATTTSSASPETHCLTATAKALYANAETQLEKDIAKYSEAKYANAVSAYKQEIEIGWNALNLPYCGYGALGPASAIHSFSKTVTHARTSFLANVKNPESVKLAPIANATVAASDAETSAAPTEKTVSATALPKQTIVKTRTTTTTRSIRPIESGLRLGMQSASVTRLQQKLVNHFGTSSLPRISGYFGPATKALVIKFQLKKGIISSEDAPGAGQVGPRTAKALNAI